MEGAGVKKGVPFEEAHLMDLAPTILYLLGRPLPLEVDGRVLKEVLEEEYLKAHPVSFESGTAGERRELEGVYRGRAHVMIIDIYKNRRIATEYGIRVIPTQIFTTVTAESSGGTKDFSRRRRS